MIQAMAGLAAARPQFESTPKIPVIMTLSVAKWRRS